MNFLPGFDRTTVISVRGQRRTELIKNPEFLYVGRQCGEWPASIWGNPFRPNGPYTVDDAVNDYENMIRNNLEFRSLIPELRGKILGCWCCSWRPGKPIKRRCHAISLAIIAYE